MNNLLIIFSFILFFSFNTFGQQTLCEIYGSDPFDETITGTQLASNLDFSLYEGKHIEFDGQILLDSDIIFKDCIISANGSPKISHSSSGNKIIFDNCKVYSCNGLYSFLAKIDFTVNTTLVVKNSKFENFIELFHISNPSNVDVQNSTFIGIDFELGHSFHFLEFDGEIVENEFIFENNTITSGSGIWLERCTDLSLNNNTFLNCQSEGIQLINSANISVSNTNFTNCKKGIENSSTTFGGNINIMNKNTFTDVEIAYNLKKVNVVTILDNVMSNPNLSGTSFLSGDEGNFNLTRNIITDQLSGSTKYAFNLNDIGNVYAFGNEYYASKGSYFFNVTSKNRVTMTQNISNGGRVHLAGVPDLNIFGNEVDAKNHKYAFYSALNPNGRFCKNSGKNASRVFLFRGNCMNTDFSNNEIGQLLNETSTSGIGLYVDDVIGRQEHKANLWNASFSIEGATNTSPNVQFSLFKINSDPNQGGNILFEPQNDSYSPSNWFAPDFSTTSFENCQSTNAIDPIGDISFVDRAIIDDHYNINPLSNWLAFKNLIKKLTIHPNLLADNDAYNWLQNQQNTPIFSIATVEAELDNYFGTSTEVVEVMSLLEDYVRLTQQIENSTPGSSNSNNINAQLIQVRSDINNIKQSIDSRQIAIYNNLSTLIPSIIPTNDYESIFKEIYTIYLEYLNDEHFSPSSADLTVIDEAANLCPLTYGPSIYIAQSLATQYGISYDEENCSEIRTRKSYSEIESEIVIYPNPAMDQITIKYNKHIDEIKIYDLNMREVKTSKNFNINTSSLIRGIYFVQCFNQEKLITTKKMILIE